ncbi:MAG: site-2 protease family protein [Phycisphaerae bacterium]|nr:site-2 protease family protein [Phycisphaerae bacterium]
MPNTNRVLILGRLLLLGIVIVALAVLVGRHLAMSWNIILAVLGFSAVVFIHECGHFFVAKAVGIKVEVFSVFIPPVLAGVRRTEKGYRVRILPRFFPKEDDPEGDGLLSFTLGRPGKAGDTEYRIGLVPVAGYVKMLGQDDLGPDKQVDDPRSFGNKSVRARMAVIAAGVTCNVIAAVLLTALVYLIGVEFAAPVVGRVLPGSAAEKAGLMPGDRIVEIAGQRDGLQPDDILAAAVLSNPGEAVPVTLQRPDGSVTHLSIVAERSEDAPLRLFGIEFDQPQGLTVAEVDQPDLLLQTTGLKAGDRVVAVNGRPVQHHWELGQAVETAFTPQVTLTVERVGAEGRVDVQVATELTHATREVTSEADLNHIGSLVPRLRVTAAMDAQSPLRRGDVLLAIGDVNEPTFKELREVVYAHANRDLAVRVLRADPNGLNRVSSVVVRPRAPRGSRRAMIGIAVALDASRPVVAKAISVGGAGALPIPRGATITAAAGQPVGSFFDLIRILRASAAGPIEIEWRAPDGQAGRASTAIPDPQAWITTKTEIAEFIPFASLKELHKARSLGQALVMGGKRSCRFVVQTYVTLKQLLSGGVNLDAMSGPVGIATITYRAVEQSFVTFLYLLAFISANLAVMNFLPLPVVDGGVFVLLIVEKIKGSPLSIRVQEVITYAGLVLIASLFLYLTYNDVLRLLLG